MVERQNLGRRRFRRRVGELLAVGKDVGKLDVRVEVAEQNLRRRRPFEGKGRMEEQKNGAISAMRMRLIMQNAKMRSRRPNRSSRRRFGAPGPSERCIITESVQRPNL